MSAIPAARPDPDDVLAKATLRAGKALGLSQSDIGVVVGRDRTSLRRGIDPEGKSGELAALLIRVYRALYVLVGGEGAPMRHWMSVANRHTGGVPREQIRTVAGLARVVEYLDAMRGRA